MLKKLKNYKKEKSFVRLDVVEEWYSGFILGMSEDLLLLNLVNRENLKFENFVLLKIESISSLRRNESEMFLNKALHEDCYNIGISFIEIDSFESALKDLFKLKEHIILETTKNNSGSFFLGRIDQVSEDFVVMSPINPSGEVAEEKFINFDQIINLKFGGNYISAYKEHGEWGDVYG